MLGNPINIIKKRNIRLTDCPQIRRILDLSTVFFVWLRYTSLLISVPGASLSAGRR